MAFLDYLQPWKKRGERKKDFAVDFHESSPVRRRFLIEHLVSSGGRIPLFFRARSISSRLASLNVPFFDVYDFEMLYAAEMHPKARRHRGAEYAYSGYYSRRSNDYLPEFNELVKKQTLSSRDLIPFLGTMTAKDGYIMAFIFLNQNLPPLRQETADALFPVYGSMRKVCGEWDEREDENPETLYEEFEKFYKNNGPDSAQLYIHAVEHDERLRPYVDRLREISGESSHTEKDGRTFSKLKERMNEHAGEYRQDSDANLFKQKTINEFQKLKKQQGTRAVMEAARTLVADPELNEISRKYLNRLLDKMREKQDARIETFESTGQEPMKTLRESTTVIQDEDEGESDGNPQSDSSPDNESQSSPFVGSSEQEPSNLRTLEDDDPKDERSGGTGNDDGAVSNYGDGSNPSGMESQPSTISDSSSDRQEVRENLNTAKSYDSDADREPRDTIDEARNDSGASQEDRNLSSMEWASEVDDDPQKSSQINSISETEKITGSRENETENDRDRPYETKDNDLSKQRDILPETSPGDNDNHFSIADEKRSEDKPSGITSENPSSANAPDDDSNSVLPTDKPESKTRVAQNEQPSDEDDGGDGADSEQWEQLLEGCESNLDEFRKMVADDSIDQQKMIPDPTGKEEEDKQSLLEALKNQALTPESRFEILERLSLNDELFQKIVRLIDRFSRRMTVKELKLFLDKLLQDLESQSDIVKNHIRIIHYVRAYRDGLSDQPSDLMSRTERELNAVQEQFGSNTVEALSGKLRLLEEKIKDPQYKSVRGHLVSVYEAILGKSSDEKSLLEGAKGESGDVRLMKLNIISRSLTPAAPNRPGIRGAMENPFIRRIMNALKRERGGVPLDYKRIQQFLEKYLKEDPIKALKRLIRSGTKKRSGEEIETESDSRKSGVRMEMAESVAETKKRKVKDSSLPEERREPGKQSDAASPPAVTSKKTTSRSNESVEETTANSEGFALPPSFDAMINSALGDSLDLPDMDLNDPILSVNTEDVMDEMNQESISPRRRSASKRGMKRVTLRPGEEGKKSEDTKTYESRFPVLSSSSPSTTSPGSSSRTKNEKDHPGRGGGSGSKKSTPEKSGTSGPSHQEESLLGGILGGLGLAGASPDGKSIAQSSKKKSQSKSEKKPAKKKSARVSGGKEALAKISGIIEKEFQNSVRDSGNASDIVHSLPSNQELIESIKENPQVIREFGEGDLESAASQIASNASVMVMLPREYASIGSGDAIAVPRNVWSNDLKRKVFADAYRKLAGNEVPGSTKQKFYSYMADEMEFNYYKPKYKKQ